MTSTPLMPKATAVWLVDNTSLTFEQIAEFCGLHVLEVKGIADGDVANGIKGHDPISSGQLSRDEIKRGQDSSRYRLKLSKSKVSMPEAKTKRKPKYTPVSRRQDRPNAILWLTKYHPELKDSQIIRLVGTTKPTIQSIRERTHWNSANLQPADPVTLGLCTQIDLDKEVQKSAHRVDADQPRPQPDIANTLLSATETTEQQSSDGYSFPGAATAEAEAKKLNYSAENVFGPAGSSTSSSEEEEVPDAEKIFASLTTEDKDETKAEE
ncbi:MAG: DUF1013 domain-containing protein [Methyloligellaceae bacterium]